MAEQEVRTQNAKRPMLSPRFSPDTNFRRHSAQHHSFSMPEPWGLPNSGDPGSLIPGALQDNRDREGGIKSQDQASAQPDASDTVEDKGVNNVEQQRPTPSPSIPVGYGDPALNVATGWHDQTTKNPTKKDCEDFRTVVSPGGDLETVEEATTEYFGHSADPVPHDIEARAKSRLPDAGVQFGGTRTHSRMPINQWCRNNVITRKDTLGSAAPLTGSFTTTGVDAPHSRSQFQRYRSASGALIEVLPGSRANNDKSPDPILDAFREMKTSVMLSDVPKSVQKESHKTVEYEDDISANRLVFLAEIASSPSNSEPDIPVDSPPDDFSTTMGLGNVHPDHNVADDVSGEAGPLFTPKGLVITVTEKSRSSFPHADRPQNVSDISLASSADEEFDPDLKRSESSTSNRAVRGSYSQLPSASVSDADIALEDRSLADRDKLPDFRDNEFSESEKYDGRFEPFTGKPAEKQEYLSGKFESTFDPPTVEPGHRITEATSGTPAPAEHLGKSQKDNEEVEDARGEFTLRMRIS